MFRSSLFFSLTGFCFFCFLSWNCTKIDTTAIGADLLPAVDNVNTFDTVINVSANNYDSVGKDCFTVYPESEHSLGLIQNDPLFGTTKSIIYTELKPDAFPFDLPRNLTLDSIVLVLSYTSSFGDTILQQKANVYEISGAFNPDSSSCSFHDYDLPVLGSVIYTPERLKDSVKGFRELSSYQLRIKLDNSFGLKLLAKDSSNAYQSDSLFKEFFKGFAIVPDASFGGNGLSYFSLADTNTKLAIYTRTTTATPDTSVYTFRLSNLSASANYVTRSHTGAEIASHTSLPPAGDEVIYIQATPGTFAKIQIPDLSNLSNRIIHRAILTMDQVYSGSPFDNIFTSPYVLYLDLPDTSSGTGYKPVPCDFNTSSGTPNISEFGGLRTTVKDPFGHDIARYTFNLARYVQKIVTNNHANPAFRLTAPYNIINSIPYVDECSQSVLQFNYPLNLPAFGRVKLGGGNNLNYRMKLYIVYSNL